MRPRTLAVASAVACVFLSAVVARADERPSSSNQANSDDLKNLSLEELMNVTLVTATKIPTKINEAPGSLTVITRQQMQDMNARTLRDILNIFVPGMDVVPAYFRYGDRVNEGIYSRGILSDFSQQVLILYNGEGKFNESTWATPFPAVEFTLDNIDQVEISRSPVPLYGGAAITIINLITHEHNLHNQVEGKLNGAVSPYSTLSSGLQSKNGSVQWEHSFEDWAVSGSLQMYDDQGQPHPDARGTGGYPYSPDTLKDGTKGAVSATFEAKSTDGKLGFQTWYKLTNRDAFLSAATPSPSNDLYKYEGSEWLTNLTYKPVENLKLLFGFQTSYWANFYPDYTTTPPSANAATPTGGDETNYDVFLEADYTMKLGPREEHSLLLGTKVEREGQSQSSTYTWTGASFVPAAQFAPNDFRTVSSVFAEDTWKISDRFSLLAGGRADEYVGFDHRSELLLNPRIAGTYLASESVVLKLLYASAGRAPSIYEREGTSATPLKGSSTVDSERLHTFEFSAIYQSGPFKAQVSPFLQLFVNKIEFLPNANDTIFTATNNGLTRSGGVDLEAWYYFGTRTYLFGNATFLKSRDVRNDHDTYFLPSQYVNAGFNYGWEKVNWNINGYFRGHRILDSSEPINSLDATGPHFMVNTSAAYDISKSMRLFFLVENLFDNYNYVPLSVDGLYVPERRITYNLGLNWSI